jgi:excinuclease UvrABC nuclease subunit
MREAAKKFEFERAAGLRDRIRALQQRQLGGLFAAVDALAQEDSAAVPADPQPAATPETVQPAPAKSERGE